MSVPAVTVRPAMEADVSLLLELIEGLADYENLTDQLQASGSDLHRHLFGDPRYGEVLIGELGGQAVGYALFFHSYSTFLSKPGIYLEDLYVRPDSRGRGVGGALLRRTAQIAVERGCARLEWAVLDWNRPAIDFYRSVRAEPVGGWTVYRLAGSALTAYGNGRRRAPVESR